MNNEMVFTANGFAAGEKIRLPKGAKNIKIEVTSKKSIGIDCISDPDKKDFLYNSLESTIIPNCSSELEDELKIIFSVSQQEDQLNKL